MPYMQGRNLQACKCKPSKILPKLVSLVLMGAVWQGPAVSQSRPGYFLQLNTNHYSARVKFTGFMSSVQYRGRVRSATQDLRLECQSQLRNARVKGTQA